MASNQTGSFPSAQTASELAFSVLECRFDGSVFALRIAPGKGVKLDKGAEPTFSFSNQAGQTMRVAGSRVLDKGRESWECLVPADELLTADTQLVRVSAGTPNATANLFSGHESDVALESFFDSVTALDDRLVIPGVADGKLALLVVADAAADTSLPFEGRSVLACLAHELAKQDPGAAWALAKEGCTALARVSRDDGGTLSVPGTNGTIAIDPSRFVPALNLRDPYLTTIAWQGSSVAYAIEHPLLPTWLLDCLSVALQLCEGNTPVCESRCLAINADDRTLFFGSLDVEALCAKVSAHEDRSFPFVLRLELGTPSGTKAFTMPLGANRNTKVFADFVSGFFASPDVVAIPDENGSKQLLMRCAGRKEFKPRGRFSLKETAKGLLGRKPRRKGRLVNRGFENRLLFWALGQDLDVFNAMVDGLADGSLDTSIHLHDDGTVTCTCMAKGRTMQLDVSSLPRAKRATMLNEGDSIEKLVFLANHNDHFERLYQMLIEIDDICLALGIEYFLAFGTLLGAERHKGFIPWDHDIDIYMVDTDFDKFYDYLMAGHGPANRGLDYVRHVPWYPEALGRYVSLDSTRFNPRKPRGLAGIGYAGIFIDVFVLCPVAGATAEERTDHLYDFLIYEQMRNRISKKHEVRDELFTRKLQEIVDIQEEQGFDAALAEAKRRLDDFRDPDSEYYAALCAGMTSNSGRIYEKRFFHPAKRLRLLDHDFSVPRDSKGLLNDMFSPSWRTFPTNVSIPGETNLFNSLKVPERLIVEEASKEVDPDEAFRIFSAHKDNYTRNVLWRNPLDIARRETTYHWQKRTIAKRIAERAVDLEACVEAEDWDTLDWVFDDYLSLPNAPGHRGTYLHVPLEPGQFRAAILCLLMKRGAIASAVKITQYRTRQGGPLVPEEAEVVTLVNNIALLRDTVEEGRLDEARELIAAIDAVRPGIKLADQIELALDINTATPADVAPLLERAKALYATSGSDYDLLLIGEGLHRVGDTANALSLYEYVAKTTRDGMVLNHINDRREEVR